MMVDYSESDKIEESVEIVQCDLKFIQLNPEWAIDNTDGQSCVTLGCINSIGDGNFIRRYSIGRVSDEGDFDVTLISLTFNALPKQPMAT